MSLLQPQSGDKMGFTFEKMCYRCCFAVDEDIEFLFLKNSLYFLEAMNFQKLQLVKDILNEFIFKQIHQNKLIFQPNPLHSHHNHHLFILRLQTYLQTFHTCIIQHSHSLKDIQPLLDRLRLQCSGLAYKAIQKNEDNPVNVVILYFQRQYKDIIESELIRQKKECIKVVFVLNHYFGKDIKASNYLKITQILRLEFQDEMKQVVLRSKGIQKGDVQILSITQTYVSAQSMKRQEFTDNERIYGLYGLQLQIRGMQFHFGLLFNLIKKLFDSISLIIKKKEDISCESQKIQPYLKSKGIKAFVLKKGQVLFINPPSNLQQHLEQLNSRKWVISQNDFLNHDFSLFKKHYNMFLTRFRQRGVKCRIETIDQHQIQIFCHQNIYIFMLDLCKDFLFDMVEKEIKVSIFKSFFQFQIFKTYYENAINIQNISLTWCQNKAQLRTYLKDEDQAYNIINQLIKQMRKSLIQVYSKHQISHKLVKCTQKPVELNYLPMYRYKLKNSHLQVQLKQFQAIYSEPFCIFFFTNLRKCRKLHHVLEANNVKMHHNQRLPAKEIFLENLNRLNSIIILKVPQKMQDKISQIQNIISYLIHTKKPFNFVLSQDYNEYMQAFILQLIQRLIFRKDSKEFLEVNMLNIYIVYQNKEHGLKIIQNVNHIFKSTSKFIKIQNYHLDKPEIDRIITIQPILIKMKKMTKAGQASKQLSPLNSYVFYNESQKRSIDHKVVLFSNKTDQNEYLTHEIIHNSSLKINIKQMHQSFIALIDYLKKIFINQSHIVVYYNKKKEQIPDCLYVYQSKKQKQLLKRQIIYEGGQIKTKAAQKLHYSLSIKDHEIIYILQTHKSFLPHLLIDMHSSSS